MAKIEKINVGENDTDIFDFLYKDWSLTLEGLCEDSIPYFVDWTEQHCDGFKDDIVTVYIIHGDVMNCVYGLTGSNAYPDDLTIVAIPLCKMVNPKKVAIPRFEIGCRWFYDIVENNRMREEGE